MFKFHVYNIFDLIIYLDLNSWNGNKIDWKSFYLVFLIFVNIAFNRVLRNVLMFFVKNRKGHMINPTVTVWKLYEFDGQYIAYFIHIWQFWKLTIQYSNKVSEQPLFLVFGLLYKLFLTKRNLIPHTFTFALNMVRGQAVG